MRKKYFKHLILSTCLFAFFYKNTIAQTTISGPSCVIPGLAIQYLINGNWTSSSTVQVCIKNGKLDPSGNTCYSGKPVSFIRVIWDNSGTNGSITINSSDGNTSQGVKITRPLRAGIIDAVSERQEIEYNSIPSSISCSPALWGTCDPAYTYQWQQSTDQVSWINIDGANNKSLTISSPLLRNVLYRRKVTETRTGTIGFSNVATVYVKGRTN